MAERRAVRDTDDAILVNWFSIEILNAKGKRTYYNSFVTEARCLAPYSTR